jgi:hypothetical protein
MKEFEKGTMFLFSLPYWFYAELRAREVTDILFRGRNLRFYFPYRSRPINENAIRLPLSIVREDGLQAKLENPFEYAIYQRSEPIEEKEWFVCSTNDWDTGKYDFFPADTIRINSYDGDTVVNIFKILLNIIRVKSNQWWIGKLPYSNEYGGPIQAEFDNNLYYQPSFGTPFIANIDFNERTITKQIWLESLSDLEKNIYPEFYKTSLLDSIYNLSQQNYESSVFEIAQSLDMAIDINYPKLLKIPESQYKRKNLLIGKLKKYQPTNTPIFLDEPIKNIIGKSFKEDFSNDYQTIETFWIQKRHKVAHGIKLEQDNRNTYFDACAVDRFIKWIEIQVHLNQ